ncbi:hypothetical protein PENSPDRAFT_647228 [Peniophora sp. CONT]|nr:hypothetical protein PENSPDRAFT_647228 [Peniophora sp. CONT]
MPDNPPSSPIKSRTCLLDLPTELLLEIAYILSDVYPATPTALGWIALGHVCSRFLGILSGAHILWARVVCLYSNAREEILARAADCPLDLIIDQNGARPHLDLIKFVLRHLPRARKINFNCDDNTLSFLKPIMTLKVSPHLESALLAVGSSRIERRMFHSAKPYTSAPKLRELYIINSIVLYSPSTLTYLGIDFGNCAGNAEVDPSDFLRYLRMCSQLQTLSLARCIPMDMPANASTNVTPSSPINLPHLRTLSIRDIHERCSALCSHLSVPTDTFIDINLTLGNHSVTSLDFETDIFKARLSGISSLGLHVDFSEGCLHVRLYDANSKPPYHVPENAPTLLELATDIACIGKLRHWYTSRVSLSRRLSMLRGLIDPLICDKVEVLQLTYPGNFSKGLDEVSKLYPNIHTVLLDCVRQTDMSRDEYASIRDMLRPKPKAPDEQATTRLPLLHTIWWQCYAELGKPLALDLLLDVAKDRARSCLQLQGMRLVENEADVCWREDVLIPAITRLCAVVPDSVLMEAI